MVFLKRSLTSFVILVSLSLVLWNCVHLISSNNKIHSLYINNYKRVLSVGFSNTFGISLDEVFMASQNFKRCVKDSLNDLMMKQQQQQQTNVPLSALSFDEQLNLQRNNNSLNSRFKLIQEEQIKTIHLIRHAEGVHNEARRKRGREAYKSWDYQDAALTNIGLQQVLTARDVYHLNATSTNIIHEQKGHLKHIRHVDLVVTSPLRRTLQTATLLFEDIKQMKQKGQNDLNFVALESIRERYGVHPCDKRSPIEAIKNEFKDIDFSNVENNEDIFWKVEERETMENIQSRVKQTLDWLMNRPETNIAIVSHHDFLRTFMANIYSGNDTYNSSTDTACIDNRFEFKNCEIKSMSLVWF